MKEIKVYVYKEADGSYSLCPEENDLNYSPMGEGRTAKEAIDEWYRVYEAFREDFAKQGIPFTEASFKFAYDVPSFLSYYGHLLTFKGLANLTGVSAAQLSQYATGYRHPSEKTVDKIRKGLKTLAADLAAVDLC